VVDDLPTGVINADGAMTVSGFAGEPTGDARNNAWIDFGIMIFHANGSDVGSVWRNF